MSSVRLVTPLVLFVVVSGATFTLAKLHPAKPEVPKAAAGDVVLGDPYHGELVFQQSCAPCHGKDGSGGAGPRLRGSKLPPAAVKAQIDAGGGTMPARIVSGKDEQDVLAYVASIAGS